MRKNFRPVLYHATSRSLELSLGDWILPPCETRNLRETQRKKNLDVVFATTTLHSAIKYAKKIKDPVIFIVEFDDRDFIGCTHISNEVIGFRAKIVHEYKGEL